MSIKPFETIQGPKQEVRNLICNHAELQHKESKMPNQTDLEDFEDFLDTLTNKSSIQEFEDYLDNIAKIMSPEEFKERICNEK